MTCAADADDLDAIELRDVARLNLNPGDTLVVTMDAPTSAHVVDRVRHRILADLGDRIDEKHLLVVSGVELSVLPADETAEQRIQRQYEEIQRHRATLDAQGEAERFATGGVIDHPTPFEVPACGYYLGNPARIAAEVDRRNRTASP